LTATFPILPGMPEAVARKEAIMRSRYLFGREAVAACLIWATASNGQEHVAPRAYLGPPVFIEPTTPDAIQGTSVTPKSALPNVEPAPPGERPLPINLPTALQLAGANPLDIALATQRLRIANAELQRANVLWLPTIYFGGDYFRHDGRLQDVTGNVFDTNKSAFMVGATPNVVFAVTDAIYAPLSARQVVRSRQADVQAARNDALLSVAEAYFLVQQARGELAGAREAARRAEDLVKRIDGLADALSPPFEKNRARTEMARRQQALETAYERWQFASAELNRLLRLSPSALVEPMEAPHLRVDLIELNRAVDDYIPIALVNRPELASQQALVQATLARLKQEKMRPLVPSVVIRGAATNPAGTLAAGYFGGGVNDSLSNFGLRNTIDFQLLWEFQNLGLGNRAIVRQRKEENEYAVLALFRTQDIVAAEVVQAYAQATRAVNRLRFAEDELKNAAATADKALEGLRQTRNIGGTIVLIVRPLEGVAAVQALDQAYRDYYAAIADANRGQFRLYRAIGQPAECLAERSELLGIATALPGSKN
jgi:outer membrane protein TolC